MKTFNKKKQSHFFVDSLVYLYLFVSLSVLPGYMICIDTGGHIKTESMWELFLCCGSSTASQANKAESFPDTTTEGGDTCQDFPADSLLSDVQLLKVEKLTSQTLSQALAINITTHSTSNNYSNRNTHCISAPHLNIPLISYSTVSLLI